MSFLDPGNANGFHRRLNLFLDSNIPTQPASTILYHFDSSFVADINSGDPLVDLTAPGSFNTTVIGAPAKFGVAAGQYSDSWKESVGSSAFINVFPQETLPGDHNGTVDFWVNFANSVNIDNNLINIGAPSSIDNFTLRRINATGLLQIYQLIAGVPTFLINGVTPVSNGVYHHIAMVRLNGVLSLYLDGALEGATAVPFYTSVLNTDAETLIVGGPFNYFSGGFNMMGSIDELRFVKGKAAWSGPFTPPTKAYTY